MKDTSPEHPSHFHIDNKWQVEITSGYLGYVMHVFRCHKHVGYAYYPNCGASDGWQTEHMKWDAAPSFCAWLFRQAQQAWNFNL